MDQRLRFEDFHEGQVFDCGAYRVSREEIFEFAREFDPQPHHLDEEAATQSILKGLSASGWHVCAVAMRLFTDGLLLKTANLGGTGVEDCRWMRPMRPDDLVRLEAQVVQTRASKSKPGIGYVTFDWRLFNERELIASMRVTVMPERRGS